MRTYSELIKLPTFLERYQYLKLNGSVGKETFGFERYLNQKFYRSTEWRRLRDYIILRDEACDLGISDRSINDIIFIHHMNPVTSDDIVHSSDYLMNPEYLICVSRNTHNAIHYGDEHLLTPDSPIERFPFDTCPWRTS